MSPSNNPKNKDGSRKMNKIRVRIAPSPTGPFHVGTARTALFNFLFARKYDGTFVVRIEDTDLERSNLQWEKDIMDNLAWLGISGDESPDKEGPYGPYRQSARTETYSRYVDKLLQEGKAYFCFHSEEELEAMRQDQLARGESPKYPGICRNLSEREIEDRKQRGMQSIIRFAVPQGRKITFHDRIRGIVTFESALLGDFAIAKDTRTPLYNLAVVIDDHMMDITHVIRGEDHISNTPKQILLQEALELPSPQYAHLPMILGPDRSKLSKRHGATSISDYREQGYLPEALVNFMALLGWNPGTDQEIFTMDQLVQEFSLERVQRSGAMFNIEKLSWMNGVYIRALTRENLTERCIPFLVRVGHIEKTQDSRLKIKDTDEEISFDWIQKVIGLEQERLKLLSEIGEATEFFFKGKFSYSKELLRWKEMTDEAICASLKVLLEVLEEIPEDEWHKERIFTTVANAANKEGDRGRFFWPFRVALSGRKASPGPHEIAEVLGKKKTLERLQNIQSLLG